MTDDIHSSCGKLDGIAFVDAENVGGSKILPALLHTLTSTGQHFAIHVYGAILSQRADFERAGCSLAERIPTANRHKNFVDQQISVDAIEFCLQHGDVKTIAIVSGDGDFIPLVIKLQSLGRTVIQINGFAPANRQLIAQADQSCYIGKPQTYAAILRTEWPPRISEAASKLLQAASGGRGINLADLGNSMMREFGFSPTHEFGIKWKQLCLQLAPIYHWTIQSHEGVVYLR